MTDTQIIPSTPYAAIEALVTNDPRLHSQHSQRQYKSVLYAFEAWRDGRPLTKSLVEAYAAELQGKLSPNTVNQKLAAIRWWARKVVDIAEETTLDDQTLARISRQAARVTTVTGVKGKRNKRGRFIEDVEIAALIKKCKEDRSPAGARDAAMIAVAWSCGLRREELNFDIDDIIQVNVGECDIKIHGKGDKVDTVFLYNGSFQLLHAWLTLRGLAPGKVFCPVRKNDKINTRGRLSGEAKRLILDIRQAEAYIPRQITWHDFRRTFVSNLFNDPTVDASTVQDLARHASFNTTKMYDRRPERRKRLAVQSMEIPHDE